MNKQISIGILVLGIVLIVWGVSASNSFSSDVTRAVTGSPTDRTLQLLGGGALLAAIGGYGMARGSSKSS